MTVAAALRPVLFLNRYGPFTNKVALTLSGSEVTDHTRAAGVQGDGLPLGSGMGIWAAATNKATQSFPGALATTGVTKAGDAAATLDKVTDADAPFQASSTTVWELDNSAGVAAATVEFDGTASAAAHAGSIFAKTSAGTPTLTIAAAGAVSLTSTGVYTRYQMTVTAGAGNKLRVTAPAGAVVRFTGAQLETGAIATPLIATNGGTAARSAARVQCPVAGLFTEGQGGIYVRWTPGWGNAAEPPLTSTAVLSGWIADSSNYILNHYSLSANAAENARNGVGGGTASIQTAQSLTANAARGNAINWAAAVIGISPDGTSFTIVANTKIPAGLPSTFDIGSGGTVFTNRQMDGNAVWLSTLSQPLSNADSALLHSMGNAPNYNRLARIANCTGVIDFREAIPVLRKRVGV